MKKLVPVALSIALAAGLNPAAAFAVSGPGSSWNSGAYSGASQSAPSTSADSATSGTWGTCAWQLDDDGTLVISSGEGGNGSSTNAQGAFTGLDKTRVVKVRFSGAVKAPENCGFLFYGFSNLESIEGLTNLDTSQATNIGGLFYDCKKLTSIDLSGFDTSQVASMECLFQNCVSLTELNLTSFDTRNVRSMHHLFFGCTNLRTLDLSSFTFNRFYNEYQGTETQVSGNSMFYNCSALETLRIGTSFDVPADAGLKGSIGYSNAQGAWVSAQTGEALLSDQLLARYRKAPADSPATWQWQDDRQPDNELALSDLEAQFYDADAKPCESVFGYTGQAIEPLIRLHIGIRYFVEGTNFSVTYRDNVQPGTAVAVFTGMGDFEGQTLEVPFTIDGVENDGAAAPDEARAALAQAQADCDAAQQALAEAQERQQQAQAAYSAAAECVASLQAAVDSDQQAYDQAVQEKADTAEALAAAQADVEAYEQAHADMSGLKAAMDQARAAYDAAVAEKTAADVELTKATSALTKANNDLANANAELAAADQAGADTEPGALQQAKDVADAAKAAADADLASAVAARTAAKSDYDAKKATRDAANAAKTQAVSDVVSAQAAANAAEAALAAAIAENKPPAGCDSNGVSYSYTAIDFFEAVGSTEAANLFETATYKDDTHPGNSWDATASSNVFQALEFIRECNELRKADPRCTQNEELLVTDRLMAYAILNANRSAVVWGHCCQFSGIGENLAQGYRDPFDGWYTYEKSLYDAGNTSAAGHYTNIIENTYRYTGFARGSSRTDSQVFARSLKAGEQAYTVDQWYERYNAWYQSLPKAEPEDVVNARAALAEARVNLAQKQEALEAATAAANEAAAAFAPAKAAYDAAVATANAAQAAADAASADAAAAEAALASAESAHAQALADQEAARNHASTETAARVAAQSAYSAVQARVTSAASDLEVKTQAYHAAKEAYDAAAVEYANLLDARSQAQAADDDAAAAVAKAQATLEERQSALSEAQANSARTRQALQDANRQLRAAQNEAQAAEQRLETAQTAYEQYENVMKITFDAGQGTVATKSAWTGSDGRLTSLPKPELAGYRFDGWLFNGQIVDLDRVYVTDSTLVAKWTSTQQMETPSASIAAIDKHSATLKVGETLKLTVTVPPKWRLDAIVSWSSDNTSIATVSRTGLVTAIAPGTVTIRTNTSSPRLAGDACVITVVKEGSGDTLEQPGSDPSQSGNSAPVDTTPGSGSGNSAPAGTTPGSGESAGTTPDSGSGSGESAGTAPGNGSGSGESAGTQPSSNVKTGATTWVRLWGQEALDTMEEIVKVGWNGETGGTVVLATDAGYWDALTAAGAAGFTGAPVLMTAPDTLSPQTERLLKTMQPTKIVICGGVAVVSESTATAAAAAAGGANVKRFAGQTMTDTADEVYKGAAAAAGGSWSTTAFVATSNGYWDALAAAPIAYTQHMPIFLTESREALSASTLAAMKAGGVEKVVIVGGTAVVAQSVEEQLKATGIQVLPRLAGQTAIDTSIKVAEYGVKCGMSADNMGVATQNGYWDALAGAALCGKLNSVLVLVDQVDSASIKGFAGKYADRIDRGFVFGGKYAVSNEVFGALKSATPAPGMKASDEQEDVEVTMLTV